MQITWPTVLTLIYFGLVSDSSIYLEKGNPKTL